MRILTTKWPMVYSSSLQHLLAGKDEDNYYRIKTENRIIYESQNSEDFKEAVSLSLIWLKNYNSFQKKINSLEEDIFINNHLSLQRNGNNFTILYDNQSIGSRMIFFSGFLNYLALREKTTFGHCTIQDDYTGKGIGYKVYRKIDDLLQIPSIPSNSPCTSLKLSNQASALWKKIEKNHYVPGISNKEDLNEEKIALLNRMYHFYNVENSYNISTIKQVADSFISGNEESLKELVQSTEDFSLFYPTEAFLYYINDLQKKNLSEDFFINKLVEFSNIQLISNI